MTLIAILSGAVIFQAFRFIAKADDNAARRGLEAAVSAAKGLRNLGAPGSGARNFAGDPKPSTATAITNLGKQLTGAKLTTFTEFILGEGTKFSCFKTHSCYDSDEKPIAASTNRINRTERLKDAVGDAQKLWIHLNSKHHGFDGPVADLKFVSNPNLGDPQHDPELAYYYNYTVRNAKDQTLRNVFIDRGDWMRLGVKSVSGNTFCAVVVANFKMETDYQTASGDREERLVNGVGWQSVNAEETATAQPNNLVGADCGAYVLQTDAGAGPGSRWTEMPGLPGTDTRLMPPGPASYGDSV